MNYRFKMAMVAGEIVAAVSLALAVVAVLMKVADNLTYGSIT